MDEKRSSWFEDERWKFKNIAVYQSVRNAITIFMCHTKFIFFEYFFWYFSSVNFPILYREVISAFIDMMNRKLDKNAHLSNQMKIWKNSSDLLDLFLEIARFIDLSRVFVFYLRVNFLFFLDLPSRKANFITFFIIEYSCISEAVFATWYVNDWIESQSKSWKCFRIFTNIAKFYTIFAYFVLPFKSKLKKASIQCWFLVVHWFLFWILFSDC